MSAEVQYKQLEVLQEIRNRSANLEDNSDLIVPDVDQIRADASGIKANSDLIAPDVDTIRTTVSTIQLDIFAARTDLDLMVPDIDAIRVSGAAIKTNTDLIVPDVDTIRIDTASIKANSDLIVPDVDTIRQDVATSKTSLSNIDTDTTDIYNRLRGNFITSVTTITKTTTGDTTVVSGILGQRVRVHKLWLSVNNIAGTGAITVGIKDGSGSTVHFPVYVADETVGQFFFDLSLHPFLSAAGDGLVLNSGAAPGTNIKITVLYEQFV